MFDNFALIHGTYLPSARELLSQAVLLVEIAVSTGDPRYRFNKHYS